MIRQGDILLIPCKPHPRPTAEPAASVTLALGEGTGHAHVIEGSILETTVGGRRLLQVLTESTLRHVIREGEDPAREQHAPHRIEPRWYEVIRQRVYTPRAPRYVLD